MMSDPIVYAFAAFTALSCLLAGFTWVGVLKVRSFERIGSAAVPTASAFILGGITLALILLKGI